MLKIGQKVYISNNITKKTKYRNTCTKVIGKVVGIGGDKYILENVPYKWSSFELSDHDDTYDIVYTSSTIGRPFTKLSLQTCLEF